MPESEFSLKKKGRLFSLPASEVDLSNVPGIEYSRWNNMNALNNLKKPEVSKSINLTLDFSEFSSDSITAETFKIKKPKDPFLPPEGSRKRTLMATPINEYSHTKANRLNGNAGTSNTANKDYSTPKEALLGCRDLLMKAYSLTVSRKTKAELLDLLDIFRHYTDKGKIQLPITFTTPSNGDETIQVPLQPQHKITPTKDNSTSTIVSAIVLKPYTDMTTKPLWTTVVGNAKAKKHANKQAPAPQYKNVPQKTSPKPTPEQSISQNMERVITVVINEGFASKNSFPKTFLKYCIL
ncbi:hypothetical protein OnM2_103026 [Erysiphe neolycopersici]|uniref:Uncharacterized protein n=1 Tax=Erysiphe neolycopersici TaxID=212602 RepID=A0A420H8C4_9PEZI|nr:hypothetical protein OnM2_103026 [Erysiphe neolycopersici]